MSVIFLNGEFVARDSARVSVFDHGYLYGDGIFEGIRAYNGRVFRLDEHLDRLYESARTIMLQIPLTKVQMREAGLGPLRGHRRDECCLTGPAAEVAPVVEVDGRPIGDGKPGAVTKRLNEAFRARVQAEGAPIFQQEAPAGAKHEAA